MQSFRHPGRQGCHGSETPTPAESQRYHYGLFHGKKHHQRKKRVFSMKYRIETQKPNI